MDLVETELDLMNILSDKVDKEKIGSLGTLVFEFLTRFSFDLVDVYTIFYSYPEIVTRNPFSIVNNITKINKHLCLTDAEFKYLILKMPCLITLDPDVLMYKLKLISITYGCAIKDSMKLLYLVPELLFITKEFVEKQNREFCTQMNEYGLKFRTILRSEPKLLFVNEREMKECKKCLMHDYTLTEDESVKVLVSSPSLLVEGKDKFKKVFNALYPTYFIKRDLKEILSYCPEFLMLDENQIIDKINSIKTSFKMRDKNVCDFVRLEPRCLFFDSATLRVKNYIKYNINLNYILSAPKLTALTEISVPLKFLITRVLYIDDMFNEVCMFDTNLFISRFLFMQTYGYFDHQDLIESEENFYKKYNISSRLLLLSYKLSLKSLSNICMYYINSKEKIRGWSDIVFPEFNDILSYVNGDFQDVVVHDLNYKNFREDHLFSRRQYDLYFHLKNLGLSLDEIRFLFNKNKALGKFVGVDCGKIIKELRKFNFTKEKIIKLLMTKQHLFNYNIRDFVTLVEQISNEEKCQETVAIEKYL